MRALYLKINNLLDISTKAFTRSTKCNSKLSITFYFARTLACDIRLKAENVVSYMKTFLIITCECVLLLLLL